jgi:membrane protein DedA with SNARE-associated domain
MLYDAGMAILEIFDYLIPTLIGIALLVFIWGVIVFIAKSGDDKAHEEGRRKMLWGVIILFVIISMWGLVRLIQVLVGVREGAVDSPYINYTYE